MNGRENHSYAVRPDQSVSRLVDDTSIYLTSARATLSEIAERLNDEVLYGAIYLIELAEVTIEGAQVALAQAEIVRSDKP